MAGSVYWVGQDGNIWLKGSGGVRNVGKPVGGGARDNGFDSQFMSAEAQRINDPMVKQETTPAPTYSDGGGAEPKVLNRAGIRNTQRVLDELPGILDAALKAERTRYGNINNELNTQEQGQRKTYDESTVTNQQNYDSNFMDSIRAGIGGLSGLMSILRGTGAGGGTAEDQARDTVGGVTANDIRVGADTRDENQTGLDSALSGFLSELGMKRRQNEDAVVNNERAIRRDSDTQMQELMGKMAGFYGDFGDEGNANKWMDRAGDLTPRIAQNSRAKVTAYDAAPVTVKAPELSAFAEPTQPSIVTAPDGEVGSGIFTMDSSRRRREQAAPVGV